MMSLPSFGTPLKICDNFEKCDELMMSLPSFGIPLKICDNFEKCDDVITKFWYTFENLLKL